MRTFYRIWLLTFMAVFSMQSHAQQRVFIHRNAMSQHWRFPVVADSIVDMKLSADKELLFNVNGDIAVPVPLASIDSLTIENEPLTEGKNPYQVFQLYITTNDGSEVTSKDYYTDCHLMLNALGQFTSYSANAQIRGRGNSSFSWYPKKPYRIKLNQKHKVLGMAKAKSWVLLANYRDITDMMNTFVFEMGRWMGLPYTNHTRYAEVFINDQYMGLYQLTEQIQQGTHRVAVSDEGGILISLDADDGPSLSPSAGDNFKSKVYGMPVCVKYPDDERLTPETVDSVRQVFTQLEQAIKDKDYEKVSTLLDIPSFIKYLQIQEFVYNVELSAPRSIFMHKDGDGPWVMGPLWDFDAGYDFDWGDMYTGHTFFSDYRETVMGTNPLKRNGNYNYVPQFFTDLFGCPEFVEAYKAQWAVVKDSIVSRNWDECMRYVAELRKGTIEREDRKWTIAGKGFETELEKMHQWLINRAAFMTNLIENIPTPTVEPNQGRLCGTIPVSTTMQWSKGYSQDNKVSVSKSQVLSLMGIAESDFSEANLSIVPLNTDGSEGTNGTNGTYGGWFDGDGNPGAYANGHVYIEVFNDLWNWNCGLYQYQCWDDEHTVTMQYQYPQGGILLKVNVEVHFTIEQNGGWYAAAPGWRSLMNNE